MDVPKRQSSGETPTPRRPWAIVLDVASECLLYIFLNYMVSCVNLSFWNHPIRILTFALNLVVLGKFLASLESGVSQKVDEVGCICGQCGSRGAFGGRHRVFPRGRNPCEAALELRKKGIQ